MCFGQLPIQNGESGSSVRTKINYSFLKLDTVHKKTDTLQANIDTVYLVLPIIVQASDTTNNKPTKAGNILITPTNIYISKDSIRGSWVKVN